jgi:hypothetical protein
VEEILQKAIAGGYIQLVLGLSTFLSFLISLTPFGDKIRKFFHLPYWFVWIFRKDSHRFLNPISNSCPDKELSHKIDRRLYVLQGDCKKLGIVSQKPRSIGSPDQFIHVSKMEVINLDSLFKKRFDNLGDDESNETISEIINFWKPHLIGEIDSKILQVVQISILCRLGFQIPFNWKLDSFEWIRYYFLKSYLMEGSISKSNLQNCFRAESYLIQKGASTSKYIARRRQIFKLDTNDRRKDLMDERVIGLLHDTRLIFDEFANIKNGDS